MVTEYNRNIIMRRKMEAAEAAEAAEKLEAAEKKAPIEKGPAESVESVVKENLTTEQAEKTAESKPKKTDAEKLKKKKA